MGFMDACNYALFDNPVSRTVTSTTKSLLQPLAYYVTPSPAAPPAPIIQMIEPQPLFEVARKGGPFVQIAGLSGATAVALGAYGAHKKYPKDKIEELKSLYETANYMHYFHTLALLGTPLSRSPKVTGSLLITGMILFSGPCYYHAFTGENKFGKLAPIGGTILILGWLSFLY